MSDDERQAQSKFHPPAVAGTGLTGPIEATPSAPDTLPDALPAEAPDPDERAAQVKAVSPSVASPAGPPEPPRAAPPPRTIPPAPASAGAVSAATAVSRAPQGDAGASEAGDDEAGDDEADFDDDVLEAEIPLTLADRLRRLSPALVLLSIGSIGSLVFLAFAMTSHTTPVPVLLSSAVVTGLAFAVDAVVASFMTWHAGQDGEARKALLLAVVGGTSAVIAAGAFAGTLILMLLLSS
jgi:hypothetical protein